MSFRKNIKNNARAPLLEQIAEMNRKIQLLERDNTAFYESSESTVRENTEKIRKLREDNKTLRKKLAESHASDEHVIREAFHNRGPEKNAFRNMSAKEAVATVERSMLAKKKRLNALKHNTQTLKQQLETLRRELRPEENRGAQSSDPRTRQKEDNAMTLRALENNLEKNQFKCKEAEKIAANYLKLKSHLQEESLTFQGQLDSLEAEILNHKKELHSLQVMKKDAQLSKEATQAELLELEEELYKQRKEREHVIAGYRRKVEELKAQAEKADRRQTLRTAMQPDELSDEVQRSTTQMSGEEDKAISTYEEAFRRIKEATGLTDPQEILERFISQKETQQHLEKMKEENEDVLQQLKEEKELLTQQFQDMKYSGEAKRSSDLQTVEEGRQRLQARQQRCSTAKDRLDRLVETLSTVRGGMEHLADKLKHITLSKDQVADEAFPDSDEYVLVLLAECDQKLQILCDDFQGKNIAAIKKEMEEEEFHVRIEGKLPAHNTRVKLPEDQRLDPLNDEEESEDDDTDVITRDELRRQSQAVIDTKSKRKPWKKKGKIRSTCHKIQEEEMY